MFEKILQFEQALAEYTGAPYAVMTDCCHLHGGSANSEIIMEAADIAAMLLAFLTGNVDRPIGSADA